MTDLSKFTEIVDLNFDDEDPHVAICHKSQGYSANLRHQALLLKSPSVVVNEEIIKSMESFMSKEEILKMTYRAKSDALETAIFNKLKATFTDKDYIYTYVKDFNESMVVFKFDEQTWATSYEIVGEVVTLGNVMRQVTSKEIYIDSTTGEELIKSSQWLLLNPETVVEKSSVDCGETNGDSIVSPQSKKEETMSEATVKDTDVVKASQEDIQKAAQEIAKAMFDEMVKAKELEELTKATVTTLSSIEFIDKEQVESIAKSILVNDVSEVIMKALSDAQEAIEKARADAEEVKKEFGNKQDSTSAKPVIEKGDTAARVAQFLQNQKKA